MLQRSLGAAAFRLRARARVQQQTRSVGSNADIVRRATPPKEPTVNTSSSAMMSMRKTSHGEGEDLRKHINAFFPINPTRYDVDETTMSNVDWRDSGRAAETRRLMEFYGITPDVVQDFTPRMNLVVRWPSSNSVAFRGNQLTPTEVNQKPEVTFSSKGRLWTLIMTDPDAPTPENGKEWLHWCVVNINPAGGVSSGQTVVDYVGAAPPKGSRFHRYVFLLCQQEGVIDPVADGFMKKIGGNSADGRWGFKTPDFLAKYKLRPKGVSFFHAKWDETVPSIYQSINATEPDLSEKKEEKKIPDSLKYTRM